MKLEKRVSTELGNAIQEARGKRTRQDVETAVGLSGNYLYKIEKYGVVPGRDTLVGIAKALKVPSGTRNHWLALAGYLAEDDSASSEEMSTSADTSSSQEDPSRNDRDDLKLVLKGYPGLAGAELTRLEGYLLNILDKVSAHWRDSPGLSYISQHGPRCNIRKAALLAENCKHELRQLTVSDYRVLLAAVLLHDVGLANVSDSGPTDEAEEKLLGEYERFSIAFLEGHRYELGLLATRDWAAVTELCRYHRNLQPLEDLKLDDKRQKALLALLRLGILMDVGTAERANAGDPLTFKRVPRDLRNAVLRNHFITRMYIDRTEGVLAAELNIESAWGDEKIELLSAIIQQDLQSALDRIKLVLITELRTNITRADLHPYELADKKHAKALLDVLNHLGTARSPNAARVFNSLVTTLTSKLKGDQFESAIQHVKHELAYYRKIRPHHQKLARIADELSTILDDTPLDGDEKIARMQAVLENYKHDQERAYASIRAWSENKFKSPARFVVFGYSDCVLTALAAIPPAVRAQSRVYVSECRNKSLYYEFSNAVEYCDGVEFARASHTRAPGFQSISIISDGSVAYFMKPAASGPDALDGEAGQKTCVLLGADGIALNGDASCTIGTLPVALAAKNVSESRNDGESLVSVYLLAEGGKVGEIPWEQLRNVRDNDWLTADQRIIRTLEKAGIAIGNPLNEKVPSDFISGYVTEQGELTPDQFRVFYAGSVAPLNAVPH